MTQTNTAPTVVAEEEAPRVLDTYAVSYAFMLLFLVPGVFSIASLPFRTYTFAYVSLVTVPFLLGIALTFLTDSRDPLGTVALRIAVLTPLMFGQDRFADLPHASTLCGACAEVCPVKIDLPRHLVNLRRDQARRGRVNPARRLVYRLWAWSLGRPWRYRLLTWVQRAILRPRADDGWIASLPEPLDGWTRSRDLPAPAERTFRELWTQRQQERQ